MDYKNYLRGKSLQKIIRDKKLNRYRKDIFILRCESKFFRKLWQILEKHDMSEDMDRNAIKAVSELINLSQIYNMALTHEFVMERIKDYKKLSSRQKIATQSIVTLCAKYGEYIGKILYEERKIINSNSVKKSVIEGRKVTTKLNCPGYPEFWMNKYGISMDEAKKLMSDRSKSNIIKTNNICRERGYTSVREVKYWESKGYTYEEAKIKVSEHQTRDLTFFIKKYGPKIGTFKYKEKTRKWISSLTNGKGKFNHSNFEEVYSKKLLYFLGIKEDNILSNFTENPLILPSENGYFIYDLCIPEEMVIVEFNGTKFHADERLNHEDRKIWKQLFSGNNFEYCFSRDQKKRILVEEKGYKVFYIWDNYNDTETEETFERIAEYIRSRR